MTNFVCRVCNQTSELSAGDIVYDGNFFHKKCDPYPNTLCQGHKKTTEQ